MSVLELSGCHDPFFDDNLFSAEHLREWLKSKHLTLPVASYVHNYIFLQVYALLSEIELYALSNLPLEKAYAIAQKDPSLSKCQYKPASRFQISSKVKDQWRTLLIAAVSAGDLTLLDYASKLPISAQLVEVEKIEDGVKTESKTGDGHDWKEMARTAAKGIYKNNVERGWGSDKESVAKEIERLFSKDQLNMTTKTGKRITCEYIVRHALSGWSKLVEAEEKEQNQ